MSVSAISSGSTVYDVRDTNKDGTVSVEEALAYKSKNAQETTSGSTATSDENIVDTVQLSSESISKQPASIDSNSTDSKSYDKKDTDKDGKVSSQEAMEYELKHAQDNDTPARSTEKTAKSGKSPYQSNIETYA